MLTEEFLKDNFVTAYFIDNEKTTIEIQTTTENKESIFTTIIPFDVNNLQYQALSKSINIDKLHELTHNKNKNESEAFKQEVIRIAKEDGLITDDTKNDSNLFPNIVRAIFEQGENEDHLFALKLALFELPTIRDCKNDELKKKLRQSKNKIDTLKFAFEITSN